MLYEELFDKHEAKRRELKEVTLPKNNPAEHWRQGGVQGGASQRARTEIMEFDFFSSKGHAIGHFCTAAAGVPQNNIAEARSRTTAWTSS